MKLLFFTRIFELAGGGQENYLFRLVKALRRRDHEIHVVSERFTPVDGIITHRKTGDIDLLVAKIQPDLSIDWEFKNNADIYRLGGGAHQYFLEHAANAYHPFFRWLKLVRNRSPKNRKIIARQRRLLLNSRALFLPNSKFAADQIIAAGAEKKNVQVLHNGVDTELFSPGISHEDRVKVRREWGIDEDSIAVLFVAHNLLLKNYRLARLLFRNISARIPRARLIVIGKNRPGYLPKNCIFARLRSSMAECYKAADCLIHPTYFDSCANVVLEAMSCGLPVLASDVCGAHELIRNNISGFVLPVVGDADRITGTWQEHLERLLSGSRLRGQMGSAARAAMLENDFNRYTDAFEKIISRKHNALNFDK